MLNSWSGLGHAQIKTFPDAAVRVHHHGGGDGPPVFMLHGGGPGASGMSNLSRNAEPLIAAGFRVMLHVLPKIVYCARWEQADRFNRLVIDFPGH